MNERNMYPFENYYPYPMQNNNPNYNINYYEDLNKRIEKLERHIKRLDQRLTRIETPYINNNNDPDNNMYMM